jgi:hypothetical protein
METFYLVCAAVGGAIFVCQFLLTLAGMGSSDMEVSHEVPHDFGMADAHDGMGHGHTQDSSTHNSTWLFSIISVRTIVAAVTFFGLTGYAALRGDRTPLEAIAIGLVCGGSAMVAVHWIMQTMFRLGQDHTLRIERAVGRPATVYLPVPANRRGEGKVQIGLQERLVEYAAMTSADCDLPAGTEVVVERIVGPGLVEVAPRKRDENASGNRTD